MIDHMFKKTIITTVIISIGTYVLWLRGELPEIRSLLESRTAGTPRVRVFNKGEFDELRKAKRKIALIVTAPWHEESKAQRKWLQSIINTTRYNDFIFYEMDFNLNKTERADLFITHPGTLIIYANDREVARLSGAIRQQMASRALKNFEAKHSLDDLNRLEMQFLLDQAK